MSPQHGREKLLQAIVYFAHHTKNLGKTKLTKLLYFLDFIHFRQTGKSVTGLDYYAWDFGPVPRDLWQELSDPETMPDDLKRVIAIQPIPTQRGGELQKIAPRKEFDPKFFSPREIKILSTVAEIFAEANAEDMVEASHLKNQPWDKTVKGKGKGEYIDYLLAVDGSADALPLEVIEERLEEMAEMRRLFSNG
jgi:uncharacterized phage-associated protein